MKVRYWREEAEEFFEDYPEPGYNKCTLIDVKTRRKHIQQRYLMDGTPDPETPCVIERTEYITDWERVPDAI